MGEPTKSEPRLKLGIRYKERKNNPPPGLVWRKVKNDESLAGVAAEYGIRPVDLALYNWHTVKDSEINWYLYYFVGCRTYKGKWYIFSTSSNKDKGWILVPDYPAAIKKGPPKSVDAVRNGGAKLDNKLQVHVVEWLASGDSREVSGKWLYVFSGKSGVNFGYNPPPAPPQKDVPPDRQPGSAFTLDFPGYFHIKERPDKLEYEILVTSKSAPSTDLLVAASGKKDNSKPFYNYGENWYVLSDPAILQKATTENRENRTTHAFRNSKTVTIDLAPDGQNKRFYFLLSPVQLGPEAIKFAMNNPAGLVPLLKSDVDDKGTWDPKDPDQNIGPTPADVKANPITLRVIDPYSWAENVAEVVYEDSLKVYIEWMNSKKNETIKELSEKTGWATLDHLYVAQILKSVRDNHPKPGSIDKELKDAAKWKSNLEIWEKELVQRNAELNANAHRSLIQLIEWLNGPAHAIIETAVLKDTNADSPQDAVDTGWSILHWAVCTEKMFALEPGIVFLRDVLNRSDSVPNNVILKHFKDLDKDTFAVKLSDTNLKGFRYGYQGVLSLLALKDFVSPPPPIPTTGTRQDYLMKLADYNKKKRDNLIKFFNDLQILPVKVQAPTPLPALPTGGVNWSVASTTINSSLDFVDKFTTYVIDDKINKPRKNWVLNKLANLEQWFEKRPTFAKIANQGSSYVLKSAAIGIASYNLYNAITTSRYDYQKNQMTVSTVDWASAVSGVTLAVQDVLAEIAALSKHAGMQRIFPQLMVSSGGPAWGVGAARVTGILGWSFAGINVLAMFVSGVTTVITMYRGGMNAASRGDYTSAAFYGVGVVGGLVMTTGAVVFGYALLQAGGVASATGVGATVGIVLFFVGGLLAAIGSIFGSFFSSDDFQVFARKCFLGDEGDLEPRFSVKTMSGRINADPPDWSLAAKSGTDTWSVEKQKRAIINLLGRFNLKTKPDKLDAKKESFHGTVEFEITPGLFRPGSTVEVAFHYGQKGSQTAMTFEWNPDDIRKPAKIINATKGGIFDVENSRIYFNSSDGKTTKKITIWADNLNYEMKKGTLLTTVSMRYPDNKVNVIRTRKAVINFYIPRDAFEASKVYVGSADKIKADDNEETSGLFE